MGDKEIYPRTKKEWNGTPSRIIGKTEKRWKKRWKLIWKLRPRGGECGECGDCSLKSLELCRVLWPERGVVFGLGCQAWKQSTESVDGDDDCSFLWSRAGEEEWVPWSELCSWNASAGNNGAMASVIPSNCFRSPRSTPLSVCVPQRSVHPTPDTTCR